MDNKNKLSGKQEVTDTQEQKVATDNQWTSVTRTEECNPETDKTATDNEWTSTNKNIK